MADRVYVFDMDDTLVDSHRRYEDGIFRVLEEAGVAYDPREIKHTIHFMSHHATATYFSSLGVPGTPEEIVERMLCCQQAVYAGAFSLLSGAGEYLRRLQAAGERLFVLTATPHRLTDACLQANGIYDLFEQVWCTEDFGHTKSETALFDKVAAAIGCPPAEILFYDDGVTPIRTARQAGWQTCGVLSPYAVRDDALTGLAHTCIHSFEELL